MVCDMRLLLLTIVVLCMVGCGEQTAVSCRKASAPERQAWDNERHPLYGDVESITTVLHHYEVDYMGERAEMVDTIQQAFFNERGDMCRRELAAREERVTYDGEGRVLCIATYDVDGVKLSSREFIYGEDGALLCEQTRDADDVVQISLRNVYNAEHQLVRQDEVDAAGRVVGERHNTYVGSRLIESEGYYLGSLAGSVAYRYDVDGNISEQSYFMGDGTSGGRRTYTYDAAGNVLTESLFEGSGTTPTMSYLYRYDEQGNRTEWHHLYPNAEGVMQLHEYYRYSYDSHHNVILTESFFSFEPGRMPSAAQPDSRLEVHIRYRN